MASHASLMKSMDIFDAISAPEGDAEEGKDDRSNADALVARLRAGGRRHARHAHAEARGAADAMCVWGEGGGWMRGSDGRGESDGAPGELMPRC